MKAFLTINIILHTAGMITAIFAKQYLMIPWILSSGIWSYNCINQHLDQTEL